MLVTEQKDYRRLCYHLRLAGPGEIFLAVADDADWQAAILGQLRADLPELGQREISLPPSRLDVATYLLETYEALELRKDSRHPLVCFHVMGLETLSDADADEMVRNLQFKRERFAGQLTEPAVQIDPQSMKIERLLATDFLTVLWVSPKLLERIERRAPDFFTWVHVFRLEKPPSEAPAWQRFEQEVAELLTLLGYQVERDVLVAGGQTDMVARQAAGPFPFAALVECKYREDERDSVGINEVQEVVSRVVTLRNVDAVQFGMVVTNGRFTKEAKQHVEKVAAGFVQLKTVRELLDGLIDFTPYLQRLVYDYEHFNDYVDAEGRRKKEPMIEAMARCDLLHCYVPLEARDVVTYQGDIVTYEGQRVTFGPIPLEDLVDEWLTDKDRYHLTLLGDFGTGKSSFCLHLAYTLAKRCRDPNDEFNRIPLYISLSDYSRRLDMPALVTDVLVNCYRVWCDWAVFRKFLEQGRVLLLLDGFDEMVTRTSAAEALENFRELNRLVLPHTKTLLTCRTHYFRTQAEEEEILAGRPPQSPLLAEIHGRPEFEILELCEFTDAQVQEALTKRMGEERAAEAWAQIQATYDLQDLAHRPILLDMIVKTLPRLLEREEALNTAELYEAYTSLWIDREDWRAIMTPEGKRALMEELACRMFFGNVEAIHFTQLPEPNPAHFKRFTPHDPKTYDLYDHDTRTCTFLNRDAEGNYKFIHRSFQEFFVACRLVQEITDGTPHFFKHPLRLVTPEIATEERQTFVEGVMGFIRQLVRGRERLWALVEATRGKTFEEVGYSGSNAATLLRQMGESFADRDLRMTVLRGAHLQFANLSNTKFDYADCRETVFGWATLKGASFRESNLEKAGIPVRLEVNWYPIKWSHSGVPTDYKGTAFYWSEWDQTPAVGWRDSKHLIEARLEKEKASFSGLDISNARGLTEEQIQFLHDHGAVGEPARNDEDSQT